jgi:uncharacterized protein (DUF983 family)
MKSTEVLSHIALSAICVVVIKTHIEVALEYIPPLWLILPLLCAFMLGVQLMQIINTNKE